MDDDTTRFSLNGSQQVMMCGRLTDWEARMLGAAVSLPTPRILIPMSDAQTYHTAIATQLIIITLL